MNKSEFLSMVPLPCRRQSPARHLPSTRWFPAMTGLMGAGLLVASLVLPGCGGDKEFSACMKKVNSSSATEKADGLRSLAALGRERATPALSKAMLLMNDPDPGVKQAAMQLLAAIGPAAKGAAKDLVQLAKNSKDPAVRMMAMGTLSAVGANADMARICNEMLLGQDAVMRENALMTAATLGGDAAIAVPGLIEATKSTQVNHRRQAAMVLGTINPKSAAAKAALEALLKDEDPGVVAAAEEALRKER